jgi:MoaA/NifB/PqqE/SkfB family radical SAM enzyme
MGTRETSMRKMHSLAYNVLKAKLKGRPYKLNYAVTYRCNARCKICNTWKKYVDSPENQKEELKLDEIDSIFRNFDLTWISLTGGEPFLRNDLPDIAAIIYTHNPHIHLLTIPTNGSLPDTIFGSVERILEETEIPNMVVSVSLDGDEGLHDRLRGVKGLWEKAKTTFELLDSLKNPRFKVMIEFTVSRYNVGHLKEAVTSFGVTDYSRVVLTAAHSSYFYGTDNKELHTESSAAQVKELLSLLKGYSPESMLSVVFTRLLGKYLCHEPFSLHCVSGRSSFFLDPYGVLYPCISMDEPFGSLKGYSLDQVLQGERARSILHMIDKGECSGCWTPCEAYQTIMENFPKAACIAFLDGG